MKLSKTNPYIWEMYNDLHCLRYTFKIYDEVYENLYEVNRVEDIFKELTFLNSDTIDSMVDFQNVWYFFIKERNYSKDSVFTYIDPKFQSILDNELYDFLQKLDGDIISNGFEDLHQKENQERVFPTISEILERGKILYDLLENKRTQR